MRALATKRNVSLILALTSMVLSLNVDAKSKRELKSLPPEVKADDLSDVSRFRVVEERLEERVLFRGIADGPVIFKIRSYSPSKEDCVRSLVSRVLKTSWLYKELTIESVSPKYLGLLGDLTNYEYKAFWGGETFNGEIAASTVRYRNYVECSFDATPQNESRANRIGFSVFEPADEIRFVINH